MNFLSVTSDGLSLRLRVTPKAAKDSVDGPLALADGSRVLGIRVRAVADKGAANKAVERTLAKWLGVAASTVSVVRGTTSRLKTVQVSGDGADLKTAVSRALETRS
ncbi:MAG: DUF167 domain-containing protein [Rhodobiaceae bacterium]|nr:DUF167 domain-containing protein [Rhodobiaceae bacterium]MCC0012516.1 DUF167 domain-containing protein [Rhodobiaceae bacterium]MCC0061723.1 DUF167 domain-containing protein [Rhodobiaceae bacterium]